MTIKVLRKQTEPTKYYKAASLDAAYKQGLFQGSMTRYELMERITKYNPELRWYANKTHRGLFDTDKGRYVCGITHNMTIPKYSIMQYDWTQDKKLPYANEYGDVLRHEIVNSDENDGKILARGWLTTLNIVESKKYKIDWRGL